MNAITVLGLGSLAAPPTQPRDEPARQCCAKCRRGGKQFGVMPCGYALNCPAGCHSGQSKSQIGALLDLVIIREPWVADALCAQIGGEDHFGPKGNKRATANAKAICDLCDVREECEAYALRNGETFGVWGGKSPLELREIRNGG